MSFTKFMQQFKTFNDKLYHVFQIVLFHRPDHTLDSRVLRAMSEKISDARDEEGLITSLKWEEYFLSLPVLQNNTTFRLSLIVVKKTHFLCFSDKGRLMTSQQKSHSIFPIFFLAVWFCIYMRSWYPEISGSGFLKRRVPLIYASFFYYYILIESINGTE